MRTIARPRRGVSLALGALAVLGIVGAGAVAAPAPAEATTNATCPAGYLCLYFNSNFQGARADLKWSDAALNNELFNDGPRGANGWNVQVGNNAASVWNRTGRDVGLNSGGNCSGARDITISPGVRTNLDAATLRTYRYLGSPVVGTAAAYQYGLKNEVSSITVDWNGDHVESCINNINQSGL